MERARIAVQPCDPPGPLQLPPILRQRKAICPKSGSPGRSLPALSPWLRHKTTRREIYDEEFRAAREKGLFDVLLRNDKGEVTEGCITNIVIYADGVYKTPPLSCGLLPGVMRQLLLQDAGAAGAGMPVCRSRMCRPPRRYISATRCGGWCGSPCGNDGEGRGIVRADSPPCQCPLKKNSVKSVNGASAGPVRC